MFISIHQNQTDYKSKSYYINVCNILLEFSLHKNI